MTHIMRNPTEQHAYGYTESFGTPAYAMAGVHILQRQIKVLEKRVAELEKALSDVKADS